MGHDWRRAGISLGVLLQAATALAEPPANQPSTPPAPVMPVQAPRPAASFKPVTPAAKAPIKAERAPALPNRRQLLAVPPGSPSQPATARGPQPPPQSAPRADAQVTQAAHLKLAPSASEIEAE